VPDLTDGFYEFTADRDAEPGKPARKKKWIFTKNDEPWFCIAGLWRTNEKVRSVHDADDEPRT
jgi:putative SOS response-associated peptidase YedK